MTKTGIRLLSVLLVPTTLLVASMASAATRGSATSRFLAKVTGKSVTAVQSLHQTDKSWAKVAATLGISAPRWKLDRRVIRTDALSAVAHREALVQQLAHASGKTIAQLRQLRKTDKSWASVAKALNVNLTALTPQIQSTARHLALNRATGAVLMHELAHNSGKTVKEIRAMQKADHSLKSVAVSLGLSGVFPTDMMLARARVDLSVARVHALVSVLAKDSGKTVKEIRTLLTSHGLTAAESTLGLSGPKVRAQVAARAAVTVHNHICAHAIEHLLSTLSGKSTAVIQGMLKSDKTWVAVARALGY